MHYDHAGGLEDFPKATFHVQEEEMWFTTGSCMCHPSLKHAYDVEHVCQMVRNVFDGRVHFHKGDAAIAPGLSLHHIGGHTAGMMSVRVNTARGQVVLASDASHFYANMEDKRPFVIVYNHADMMQGHRKLYELADSQNHVIRAMTPWSCNAMRRRRTTWPGSRCAWTWPRTSADGRLQPGVAVLLIAGGIGRHGHGFGAGEAL